MPQVLLMPEAVKSCLRHEMFCQESGPKERGLEDAALQLSCYEMVMILIFNKYGSFR